MTGWNLPPGITGAEPQIAGAEDQYGAEAWERIDAAPWNQTSDAYLRDYDEEYSARMEYEAEQEAERRYVVEHTSAECLTGNHDGCEVDCWCDCHQIPENVPSRNEPGY